MMSLIDLDDDQRWVPTHVNVTVLRARRLRTKGKHGSRYLYAIIQVGKEKHTTGLVEKAEVPEWNEECCFELLPGILEDGGRDAYPPGSGDLVLTVMHRVLIGLDVFLGQTIIPLDKIFQERMCPRDEWFRLNSKSGRKEKERGELQVTVQFTRNNMTASMFDLTIKDKPRSAFGKLKDRVTGRKRADVESSSAIVPGRYAALSGSLGQSGGGALEQPDVEVVEEKRSKMKEFLKGKLRKSSDTRSCSSLASESSAFSGASDNPPPSLDLLSDPPSSPVYTTKVRLDTHYGEIDLAKKVLTSQHTTKVLTHKRAFSDEVSKIETLSTLTNPAVESIKGQTMTQSKSSLCINGSHVYDSKPSTPKSAEAHPSKLDLLEKCSPLSRSLQNLTRRSEDKGSFAEGRRWSFDKVKKEGKEEEKEPLASSPPVQQNQTGVQPVEGTRSAVSSSAGSPEKGKKPRKTLFSAGRSESLPAKSDLNQAVLTSDRKLRGWFGSGDSQNKPRLEVSPKVESGSDVPPPPSHVSPLCSSPFVFPSGHVSLDDRSHVDTFTASHSSNPVSLSSPFPSCMQRNPFFAEHIAEESQRSPPFVPSGSSPFKYTTLPSTPNAAHDANATIASIKRERPRPVARQISLPALLSKEGQADSSNGCHSMSECAGEWDVCFDAFASRRLNSLDISFQKQSRTIPTSSHELSYLTVNDAKDLQSCDEEPPPLPPRRFLRTPVKEISSDGWLHRGQELAVHKEAYLLSQTGVASLQRGREGRHDMSPDPHINSQPSRNITSPGFMSEKKLKKFKYEPLEGDTDCLGGMLFEQDLYGRLCRGNQYMQTKVDKHYLSINAEQTSRSKITSVNSKVLLDSEITAADLLNLSSTPSHPKNMHAEETESILPVPTGINNVSFSLTLGDQNMNVSNPDSSFIDPDVSSLSDGVDTLKGTKSVGAIVSKMSKESLIAAFQAEARQDVFTLKDTYIPGRSSSFESSESSNTSSVCQNNCQGCRCELNNVAPHGTSRVNSREMSGLLPLNQTSSPPDLESRADMTRSFDDSKKTPMVFDDNGNLQSKISSINQSESFSGVVSARIRPKGVSRQNSRGSPRSQTRSEDREFEQLLSLVQNISGANVGPLSYQFKKSNSQVFNKQTDNANDQTRHYESDSKSQTSSKASVSVLAESPETGRLFKVSFEDLHAKVAPNSRTSSKNGPETFSPSIPCAPSLQADTQAVPSSHPLCYPSSHPSSVGPSAGASTTQAEAPYLTSSTFSNTDQPLVEAQHSLLPEETHPACNLPCQESRSHPVKPLSSSQSEKKESRSVLEKLKSTINPGRATQKVTTQPQKSQEVAVDRSAHYQHLTNMELISLLLQQEMDMQKQQTASEQQGTQLQKCEAELKKVKSQVRDLEDYIDNLLLRIMEQTPTLLQVRTRHK